MDDRLAWFDKQLDGVAFGIAQTRLLALISQVQTDHKLDLFNA